MRGTLAYCPICLLSASVPAGTVCRKCGVPRKVLFGPDGAMTRDFLLARGVCCYSNCRNCPYQHPHGAPNVPDPDVRSD